MTCGVSAAKGFDVAASDSLNAIQSRPAIGV